MTNLAQWLDEYSASHRNPTNKLLHRICVPLIVFSVGAALEVVPVGHGNVNLVTIIGMLTLAYYFRLSWRLALGMTAIFLLGYWVIVGLHSVLGLNLLWLSIAIFVVAWIGQFVGHYLERARPSFFKDLQFLLIGPLWLLDAVYRGMSIPTGRGVAAH